MNDNGYRYTPFYCEENVWFLCKDPRFRNYDAKVVLITNKEQKCPFWQHQLCESSDNPVYWDYHVILIFCDQNWMVWDFDSILECPVSLKKYITKTFKYPEISLQKYEPVFKIIDSSFYVAHFSSDRSHMKLPNGGWLAPPPPWEPIHSGTISNFVNLLRIDDSNCKEFLTIQDFYSSFSNE